MVARLNWVVRAGKAAGRDARTESEMRNVQEIVAILRQAMPELSQDFSVTRLAVFGSYARGQQTESSDVDILVEVDPSIGLRFVDLAERIESLLGVPADVVSRRAVSPRHWAIIRKELVDVA